MGDTKTLELNGLSVSYGGLTITLTAGNSALCRGNSDTTYAAILQRLQLTLRQICLVTYLGDVALRILINDNERYLKGLDRMIENRPLDLE